MKKFTLPNPEFSFAGFTFPKWVFTLPYGSKSDRIKRMKNPVTGAYYRAPKPDTNAGASFYLESDGMPGLRWIWCDQVDSARINHEGWFCDEYEDNKIRGLIMRLPKSRGFLAGWSMGRNMLSFVDPQIYESDSDAAYAADNLADDAAEKEREYQEKYDKAQKLQDDIESSTARLRECFTLRNNPCFKYARNELSDLIKRIRADRATLIEISEVY